MTGSNDLTPEEVTELRELLQLVRVHKRAMRAEADAARLRARATPDTLGARIRALREERRLKQSELAARAGIRAHSLWRLEAGEHKNATTRVLQALARELDVTADVLLGVSDKPRARSKT